MEAATVQQLYPVNMIFYKKFATGNMRTFIPFFLKIEGLNPWPQVFKNIFAIIK
jgi:hypothetical protein